MKSEFEKAYEPNPHKSPFTEVRFNEEKQIYEPLNPPLDRVARSLNAAWYGYRIRQTEVDEARAKAQMCRDEKTHAINRWSAVCKERDELQKRVDAAFRVLSQLNALDDEAHKRWKREACMFSQGESNAYEHAVRLLEQSLNGEQP